MSAGGATIAGLGTIAELQAINNERAALGSAYSFNIRQAKEKEEEILRRMRINTSIAKRQSAKDRGEQQAAFASSGIAGGQGSPLALLAEQEMFATREIIEMRRQAKFDARQAKLERMQLQRARGFMNTAQDLKQIQSLLSFGVGVTNPSGRKG